MKNFETEFKWDANTPRAFINMKNAIKSVLGSKELSLNNIRICDTYLDDKNQSLSTQKIALRIREWNGNFEVTYKTKTELVNGKAVREENTIPLVGVKTFKEALEKVHTLTKWKDINLKEVLPVFSLYNNRNILLFNYQKIKAEIAFDSCKIVVKGRKLFFKEIELELKEGEEKIFDILCNLLSSKSKLMPNRYSKIKTATTLLKLWE